MQHLHGFLHSIETDQTKPKHHYWVQKRGLGAFVHFWIETVHRFVNDPNGCIKCNICKVFCTVTKLTKTNPNITIGSKNVNWVRSFRFWIETVHRFVNDPNGCIKCQNEPKHHYWVQKRGLGAFVSFLDRNRASFR